MRLKVYHAPNIGVAMAMVRDDLGPDALILANRIVDGGVELTAAQDHPADPIEPVETATPTPVPMPMPMPLATRGRPVPKPPLPIAPTEVARPGTLRWHGVPADMAARLSRGDLPELLAAEFRFHPLPCRRNDAPLLLVGPPGAGKTLTAARLATRLKISGQSSMVITADGRRAGAAEQLAAFTRLLGLPLIVADNSRQLARAVARRAGAEPVLIDMPGLDPFNPEDETFLRECQSAVGGRVALVIPAGLDPADAQDMASAFVQLGATHLIATRLDQSRRLGGILAAAAAGLAFAEAGISSAVANGLTALTPEFLAGRLSQARVHVARIESSPPISPLALLAQSRPEQPRSFS